MFFRGFQPEPGRYHVFNAWPEVQFGLQILQNFVYGLSCYISRAVCLALFIGKKAPLISL